MRPSASDRLGGDVLAEVLHPAVVPVVDRLGHDRPPPRAGPGGAEVDEGRRGVEVGEVRQGIGGAERRLHEPAVGLALGVGAVGVVLAHERVDVGGHPVAPRVVGVGGRALLARRSSARLRAAREVVGVGLGDGDRDVQPALRHRRAPPGAQRVAEVVGPVGWYQGPKNHLAGAGCRPTSGSVGDPAEHVGGLGARVDAPAQRRLGGLDPPPLAGS